jgi:pimeloyl-ACP methyl ester carboxylesterase
VRLTRYRPRHCLEPGDAPPVAMIHGYSASGTTFAHHAVRPNLAGHFSGLRRDVWILDLRTSSGMPTARQPWKFEDAALADLPAAFDHIRRATGSERIDVIAHCVGAAMFSMAVLAPPAPGEPFYAEREALPRWIRKAVLSQVGPAIEMTAANIFRAYAMSYLRHFLPFADYDFRVRQDPGLIDQLIDRLLATQPYPEKEFDIENPPLRFWRRTPFAGTRHRMDALYGRDFNLAGRDGKVLLDDKVLEYIDDLFGPLSLETVSQAIHFARLGVVTNRDGSNEYLLRRNLLTRWIFPTLSVHGRQNGLFDIATLARLEEVFRHVPRAQFTKRAFDGFGHQDCLIGRRAGEVFDVMSAFLA